MKARDLSALLDGTNQETTALVNLHGKLYETTTTVVFNGEDDPLSDAVRVELPPVGLPALRKYEVDPG